jgi:hypothetical protein
MAIGIAEPECGGWLATGGRMSCNDQATQELLDLAREAERHDQGNEVVPNNLPALEPSPVPVSWATAESCRRSTQVVFAALRQIVSAIQVRL